MINLMNELALETIAGLEIQMTSPNSLTKKFTIKKLENPTKLQSEILKSWLVK